MIQVIPASKRHFAHHGWLKTYWLFSFSEYQDPKNIHHGVLRVFNDDYVAAGQGFGMHPHQNMEIVTIILSGAVSHQDSMGNKTTIRKGEVQRMTAGTGVYHSEINKEEEELHLYQLWIFPEKAGLEPSYEQKSFDLQSRKNELVPVVSPEAEDGSLHIHQDATIFMAGFEQGKKATYTCDASRKVFIYLTSGKLTVNGQELNSNDQARISDETELVLEAGADTEFVMIDAVKY